MEALEAENMVCTGCGKDPYKSSTGCLCGPDDEHEWVPGHGSYGQGSRALDPEDHGGVVACSCGADRTRASMAQNRVLPCDVCGDDAREAIELMRPQVEHIPGCTYCKQCGNDISMNPDMCPDCDGPVFPAGEAEKEET
eukprot:TRINITY_DN633_c0_g1_i5.p2 TRINITY_DN633_c0_g1~~TRINITY_DN633_c0_g1_i5.p2  ORF type:complete len:139 (+),score=21.11 TRINITY_DN633_c0_g1_i5:200-616(+)